MRSSTQTATKPGKLHQLVVGSSIFYPAHGVAEVVGIEQREVGQEQQEFYVLALTRGGKLLLPTANVEQAGVRALISQPKARALMKTVETAPEVDDTPAKERAALYADALRGGAADRYTEILRQLLFRSKSDKLSSADRRLLDIARAYFCSEIGAVLERPSERIAEQLISAVNGPRSDSESKK